jgi:hypothetical protein
MTKISQDKEIIWQQKTVPMVTPLLCFKRNYTIIFQKKTGNIKD